YPAPNPYAQQPNYAQPQFPNQPVYAPPPKKKSNAPLIIAGVICLVVVVGIVIALVAVSSGSKGTGNSGTSGGKSGDYSMAKVSDACSLIEPAVLSQWAANPKGSPTHTETQPTSYSGGSLRCQLSNKGGEDDTDSADMDLDGDFLSKYGSPEYNSWKDTDTRTTGSGRSSGALTGVGDEGYYAIEQTNYSSFVQYDYTCATKASNVSLKVRISLTVSGASTGTVASTCKDQLSKALGALKK
ncbi:MAG: hypothetical protein J2P18_12555, partial [Nocardia sp.]|nr:hypothetical protein [Nocardia sp.]